MSLLACDHRAAVKFCQTCPEANAVLVTERELAECGLASADTPHFPLELKLPSLGAHRRLMDSISRFAFPHIHAAICNLRQEADRPGTRGVRVSDHGGVLGGQVQGHAQQAGEGVAADGLANACGMQMLAEVAAELAAAETGTLSGSCMSPSQEEGETDDREMMDSDMQAYSEEVYAQSADNEFGSEYSDSGADHQSLGEQAADRYYGTMIRQHQLLQSASGPVWGSGSRPVAVAAMAHSISAWGSAQISAEVAGGVDRLSESIALPQADQCAALRAQQDINQLRRTMAVPQADGFWGEWQDGSVQSPANNDDITEQQQAMNGQTHLACSIDLNQQGVMLQKQMLAADSPEDDEVVSRVIDGSFDEGLVEESYGIGQEGMGETDMDSDAGQTMPGSDEESEMQSDERDNPDYNLVCKYTQHHKQEGQQEQQPFAAELQDEADEIIEGGNGYEGAVGSEVTDGGNDSAWDADQQGTASSDCGSVLEQHGHPSFARSYIEMRRQQHEQLQQQAQQEEEGFADEQWELDNVVISQYAAADHSEERRDPGGWFSDEGNSDHSSADLQGLAAAAVRLDGSSDEVETSPDINGDFEAFMAASGTPLPAPTSVQLLQRALVEDTLLYNDTTAATQHLVGLMVAAEQGHYPAAQQLPAEDVLVAATTGRSDANPALPPSHAQLGVRSIQYNTEPMPAAQQAAGRGSVNTPAAAHSFMGRVLGLSGSADDSNHAASPQPGEQPGNEYVTFENESPPQSPTYFPTEPWGPDDYTPMSAPATPQEAAAAPADEDLLQLAAFGQILSMIGVRDPRPDHIPQRDHAAEGAAYMLNAFYDSMVLSMASGNPVSFNPSSPLPDGLLECVGDRVRMVGGHGPPPATDEQVQRMFNALLSTTDTSGIPIRSPRLQPDSTQNGTDSSADDMLHDCDIRTITSEGLMELCAALAKPVETQQQTATTHEGQLAAGNGTENSQQYQEDGILNNVTAGPPSILQPAPVAVAGPWSPVTPAAAAVAVTAGSPPSAEATSGRNSPVTGVKRQRADGDEEGNITEQQGEGDGEMNENEQAWNDRRRKLRRIR